MRRTVVVLSLLVVGAVAAFGPRLAGLSVPGDAGAPDGAVQESSREGNGLHRVHSEAEEAPQLAGEPLVARAGARSVGDGARGVGDHGSSESDRDAGGGATVEFHTSDAIESRARVVLCAPADSLAEVEAIPLGADGRALRRLESGKYVAALQYDGLEQGARIEFEHGDSGTQVRLPPLERMTLTFLTLHSKSREAVIGAKAGLRRVDLFEGALVLEGESGADGRVTLEGLTAGEYELTVGADGFTTALEGFEFPGIYRPWLKAGVLDLQYWLLYPETQVVFELVGHEDWGTVEGDGFTLKVVGETESVSVGEEGEVPVTLGEYSTPLQVVIDYPGGDRAIVYLDESEIYEGARCRIDVGRGSEIEVDLRVANGISEELFSEEVYLQASFIRDKGGSSQINTRIYGDGVFSLSAPFSSFVTLSVTSVSEGGMRMWAASDFELAAAQDEGIVLNIVSGPRALRVTSGGDACPDAYVLVRMVPDRSLWVAGGMTDQNGMIALPSVEDGSVVVDCSIDDVRRAINLPIQLSGPESVIEISLDALESYVVDVRVDGVPGDGRKMRFLGAVAQDPLDYTVRTSDADGVIRDLLLVRGSRVAIAPDPSDDLWPLVLVQRLQAGQNRVELFTTGVLTAPRLSALLAAAWAHNGTSVSAWVGQERTAVDRSTPGRFAVRVPVGVYSAIGPDGEEVFAHVKEGEEVSLY